MLGVWALTASAAPPDVLPPIGTIDFFGLRTVKEADVRKALPFKEGDLLERDRLVRDGTAVARALGVAEVTLAYICCTQDQKMMAYVGVAEKNTLGQERTLPGYSGTARLPEEMILAYDEFGTELVEAIKQGQAREDHSQGHALNDYPPMRAIEQKFLDYARDNVALASEVLTSAADTRHRAAAAMILGYAPDKRAVVGALARGVSDSEKTVRNNATRALGVIAEYSLAHPDLGIHIDAAPFVEMLNSVVWTDRNKGLMVLTQLTAPRDAALLQQLRDNARPALDDMCRWKNPGHAMSACLILRRVDGKPD
jgi:hypothetical protein